VPEVLQQVTRQPRWQPPVLRRRDRQRRPRRRRPVLRFVAAVMTTSGLLLLADAGLTLAWQEPVSAVIALREQSALEDELEALPVPELPGGDELSDKELRRLAEEHEAQIATGEAWGRIELPSPDRDFVVVEGTDEDTLRSGPGHYPDTALPGEGRTVAIAGHRTTYLAPFRTIDQLAEGDELVIELPYARFSYSVQKQKIVDPSQISVTRDVERGERLVLSACHPLYSAAERLIVFADLEDVTPS
jgi:sortase A